RCGVPPGSARWKNPAREAALSFRVRNRGVVGTGNHGGRRRLLPPPRPPARAAAPSLALFPGPPVGGPWRPPPSPRLGLAPLLAQPLQPALEDLADQLLVLDAGRLRDQAQVRISRRQPWQRVHLDDVDLTLRRHAQVDARDVAAVERRERLAADALDRL